VSDDDRQAPSRRPYESPLRKRQAAQTRDAILDALTRLLQDRRTDEVTTRELAGAAGVSERTVYRHFPDRMALVEGLSDRLEAAIDTAPAFPRAWDDLRPMAVQLMGALETHDVEARAEALLNADPRRYTNETRQHTADLQALVERTVPELDDGQQRSIAAVVRVLASAQTWLRLREEWGIPGDVSGPVVAWAIDALLHEIRRGNPPPAAGDAQAAGGHRPRR